MAISKIDNNALGTITSIDTGSATGLTLKTAGTTALTINASQNVGIGMTSPGYKLEVHGISPAQITAGGTETSGAANTGGGINFIGNDGVAIGRLWGWVRGHKENSTVGDVSSYMSFATRKHPGGSAEIMRIDSSGNVGIGTSSPSYKLSVNGTGNFYAGVAGLGRVFLGDPLDPSGYIGMYRSALGSSNSTTGGNSLNFASFDGYTFNTGSVAFGSQTERMRIDGSGNVTLQKNISVGGAAPTTSGTGITFPATQSASSDANTLDDYEEGTWTPTLGGTTTHAAQVGNYVKVGSIVTVWFDIIVGTIGTGSLSQVFGLPWAGGTGAQGKAGAIGYFANLAVAPIYLSGRIDTGSSGIQYGGLTAASATMSSALNIFGNSARMVATVTYSI